MPRVGSKKKKKPRSHDKGLWIVTVNGTWIEVKKSAITAEKIVPQPAIRIGKPYIEGKPIELLESATFPVHRESHVELVKAKFAELGFTAKEIWPGPSIPVLDELGAPVLDDEGEPMVEYAGDPIAETRYNNLLAAFTQISTGIPLDTYSRSFVDRNLQIVEEWEKYRVVGYNEVSGLEILEQFPHLQQTHQIHEKVLPRIYYDLWLTEKLYELPAYDDAGRFELWKLAQRLNDYPFPIFKDGKATGEFEHQEAMLYMEGYVAQTGSSQQYHAFIAPQRITQENGSEEFILEMKLSKTLKQFSKSQPVPKPDEVPVTVTKAQKPLIMAGVAEMLKAVAV